MFRSVSWGSLLHNLLGYLRPLDWRHLLPGGSAPIGTEMTTVYKSEGTAVYKSEAKVFNVHAECIHDVGTLRLGQRSQSCGNRRCHPGTGHPQWRELDRERPSVLSGVW